MGDDPEPKAFVKKVYKCGEDDATLPNRFGKIDGSQAHHSQMASPRPAYSFKWVPVQETEKEEKMKVFKKKNSIEVEMVESVPDGVRMPSEFSSIAEDVYNFETRPKDVWIVTYPKCGTTWTQEIVWQITRGFQPEESKKVNLEARSPYLEVGTLMGTPSSEEEERILKDLPPFLSDAMNYAKGMGDPRVIKTHLPVAMLNPDIFENSKVVYVCRNPKDTCASYFHHCQDPSYGQLDDFEKFADCFKKGTLLYGDYWHHLKTAQKMKDNPNFKIIWFEEMKKDLPKVVRDLCNFLGYELSPEKIEALVKHVSIDNMRDMSVKLSPPDLKEFTKNHYRKGKVGGWKDYFKGERLLEWNKWIEDNLSGTDIKLSFE